MAGPSSALELRAALIGIVGEKGCLFEPADTAPFCEDYRQLYKGRVQAVVRPATTEEVARVVRLCAERRIGIVPQGGNTSLVAGAVPSEDGSQIVLSLGRINKIREIDPVDLTMTIEAGVVLKNAQEAVLAENCMLPISMSSEGSAQIGGVLAVNAGGNNTVRYGNARDLVLGLEVVLPNGEIWNGLRRLRKDNTGYCLRQLFVGSEGTLGIITAAVLKLVPRPRELAVALCAVPTAQAALDLFVLSRQHHHEAIQAFEYMSGLGLRMVLKHIADTRLPLEQPADHYVLLELADVAADTNLREKLEETLGKAMEAGLVLDAVLAGSSAERLALWKLREEHTEAQKRAGANIKNDVTVPVSKVPQLLVLATEACQSRFPGIRVVPFGHMGDGNIHFNVVQPEGASGPEFLRQSHDITDTINAVVRQFDGSFSAEHGVGRLKPYLVKEWRGGAELETMWRIKTALDPLGIMNPGKILP
ncbi:MAG: FAD-binding oxidoreductase [Candidatus Korobacteraceae bacterium]